MHFKPLIPAAIAIVLSWSATAVAGSVSMTVGNVSVSSNRNGATVSTNRARTATGPSYWWHSLGLARTSSSRAAAVSKTRSCAGATQRQTSHSSGGSVYQSQSSQVCR